MKNHEKVYAAFIMLIFLIPNICAIYKGKESYPFTPAPMFGGYIGDSTRFYDFKFIANGISGDTTVLPSHIEHDFDLAISRLFFDKCYWSVDPSSPLGVFNDDTPEKFEGRMDKFFSVYFKNLNKDSIKVIRLTVNEFDRKYKRKQTHTVGYYSLASKKFTHTWKQ